MEEALKNGELDSDDDSTSEEEDDAADLATADLDNEIFATLDAIKKKDPRVYDPNVTFYTPFEAADAAPEHDAATTKKEKPMYLKDYHRKNLLEGNPEGDADDDAPLPRTYAQEQQDLKNNLVNQMHTATADDEDDEDGFLVKKDKGAAHTAMRSSSTTTTRPRKEITEMDIKAADRDPETFLSNFMASRAWVPEGTSSSRFQAFDSDDSDGDLNRADQFEAAYNLRFEDPKASNEKLMTFSRDIAKYSVRRDDLSGRKKQREKEREKKDAEKKERDADKARLRKLKIDEVEEKVKKIKEAAGLGGEALDIEQWREVLEEDWNDDRWEQEMQTRFGEGYYAEKDARFSDDEEENDDTTEKKKSKKVSKPKWDDDIDIKDILPEFQDEEETVAPPFSLSDVDDDDDDADNNNDDVSDAEEEEEDTMDIDADHPKRKTKKDRLKEKADAKRVARKERMAIESLVDADLTTSLPSTKSTTSSSNPTGFRYRATSPDAFGLTPRDILFADDAALNQFAGLKKMATFRDEEKKRRDRKKLGKKARLRQWRKETFGLEEGFQGGFKEFLEGREGGEGRDGGSKEGTGANGEVVGGSRKRRGKKRKVDA